jgi:hypothetical protein
MNESDSVLGKRILVFQNNSTTSANKMNPTTRITFCVNTPLYIEVSFKDFRTMEGIATLNDETAQAVWDLLVDRAGKEKTIMSDAATGYSEDEATDAFGEVEQLMNEALEQAVDDVNEDVEEQQAE